jgi:hypothetical protein
MSDQKEPSTTSQNHGGAVAKTTAIARVAEEKVVEAAEKASSSFPRVFVALRTLLQQIPILGSFVDGLLSGRLDARREAKMLRLLEYLKEKLEAIDQAGLDREFLESDEFTILLAHTMREASDAYEDEKLKVFASFLRNSLAGPFAPGYRERTLALIASLNMGHLEILRTIHRGLGGDRAWDELQTAVAASDVIRAQAQRSSGIPLPLEILLPRLSEDEQIAFGSDLHSKGLLDNPLMGHYSIYRVTRPGYLLLRFIRDEPPQAPVPASPTT